MVDEGSSSSAANLVGFFLEFAEKLLASARSHVASEGMPKRVEHPFLFRAPEFTGPAASGSTISFSGVEKPDFRGLLLFNRERWAKAEAERCAREHFEHDVRRDLAPLMSHQAGFLQTAGFTLLTRSWFAEHILTE